MLFTTGAVCVVDTGLLSYVPRIRAAKNSVENGSNDEQKGSNGGKARQRVFEGHTNTVTCLALLNNQARIPSTLNPQLYTPNPQPSTLHPQPPTFNPTLSTLNLQPLTLNPRPDTLNSQPSTLNPQPYTLNPQPYTLEPSTLNPQPYFLNHKP